MPLNDVEKMVVLTSAAGNTGWHFAITHNPSYAPHFPNYAAAAGGRTFPSAAGFHTSEVFSVLRSNRPQWSIGANSSLVRSN